MTRAHTLRTLLPLFPLSLALGCGGNASTRVRDRPEPEDEEIPTPARDAARPTPTDGAPATPDARSSTAADARSAPADAAPAPDASASMAVDTAAPVATVMPPAADPRCRTAGGSPPATDAGRPADGGTTRADAATNADGAAAAPRADAGVATRADGGAATSADGGAVVPAGATVLVDDFEDGDTSPSLAGLTGSWFTAHDDAPGVQVPDPLAITTIDNCPGAKGYAQVRGAGFGTWGALMGIGLQAGNKEMDLGAYKGIQFWARLGKGADTAKPVRLRIYNKDTDPAGMTCDKAGPDGTKGCHNHFGRDLVELSAEWQRITVLFSEVAQLQGWGRQIATGLDVKGVYGIDFFFSSGVSYDLWIDDFAFIKK